MRATLVAAGAFILLAAPAAGAGNPPSLRLVARHPVTVRIAGFVPRERVTVTVSSAGHFWIGTGRTTARGGLTVAFPDASVARCGFYTLRALGARGDGARYTSPAETCVPVGTP